MAFPEPGSPAEILRAHVIVARTPSDLQRTQQGLPGLSAAGHRFALALHRPEADALSGGEAHEPLRARLGYLTPEERREHLVDFVRSHVNGVLHRDPSKPISRDRRLMDLGVDSLMAVELRDRLGRGLELDRSLPATLIFDHPTIDAIADYIEREVLGVHCHAEPRGEKDNAVCEDSPLGAEVLGNLADDEVEKLILKKLEAMDKEE
jgi:acyl carrier protein